MEEENLYPNDGSYFMPVEPEAQVRDRKQEKAKILQGAALLKEVIERLEKRIEFYSSVDSIPEQVKADPAQFMNMHNANELTRDNLRSEKEYLESLLDTAETKEL